MSNFSLKTENVCPIIIISKQEFIKWNQKQSTYVKSWVKANAFKGALFDVLSIPSDRGGIDMVLLVGVSQMIVYAIDFILQKLEIRCSLVRTRY